MPTSRSLQSGDHVEVIGLAFPDEQRCNSGEWPGQGYPALGSAERLPVTVADRASDQAALLMGVDVDGGEASGGRATSAGVSLTRTTTRFRPSFLAWYRA